VSAGLVAIAEIGDKTQLLAMILATRYRKPVPIILGILVATLANHALAAWAGTAARAPAWAPNWAAETATIPSKARPNSLRWRIHGWPIGSKSSDAWAGRCRRYHRGQYDAWMLGAHDHASNSWRT